MSTKLEEQFARISPALTGGDEAKINEVKRIRDVELLIDRCGVPKRYREVDLSDLSQLPQDTRAPYAKAVKLVRAHMSRDGAIVSLLGSRGPGKTAIVCGIVMEFCRAGKPAVYIEAVDFFEQVKRTFGGHTSRDEIQVVQDLVKPALLVVDSLEERGDTPWEDRMLTRLINKRYGEERSIILVANQTPKDFAERIGESITDRIMDGGGRIECQWKSLRGRILPESEK